MNETQEKINHYNWIRKDSKRVHQSAKLAKLIWLAPYNDSNLGLLNFVGRWSWFTQT